MVLVVIAAGFAVSTACRHGFDNRDDSNRATGDGASSGDDASAIDGTPVDVVISSSLCPNATLVAPAGTQPTVAWSGTAFGVAYIDGSAIRFAPVDAAGVPSASTLIGTGGTGFDRPQVVHAVWQGSAFAIAHDGGAVRAVTVSANGAVVNGPATIDTATNSYFPSFAIGGATLRINWTSYVNSWEIMTSSLADDLTGLNPTQVTNSSYESFNARAAWTGTDWGLVWDDSKFSAGCVSHGLYFQQVRGSGMLAGNAAESYQFSCTSSGNTERRLPEVVWNGADLTVAWNGTGTDPNHVYVARMNVGTGALTTIPIAPTSAPSTAASIIWTGTELGLAWAGNGVIVTRANASGMPVGEVPLDTSGASPAIAWDGARYLVAYEKEGAIYVAGTCP